MGQVHLTPKQIAAQEMFNRSMQEQQKDQEIKHIIKQNVDAVCRTSKFPVDKMQNGALHEHFILWLNKALTHTAHAGEWPVHRSVIDKALDGNIDFTIDEMQSAVSCIAGCSPINYFPNADDTDAMLTEYAVIKDEMYRMQIILFAYRDALTIEVSKDIREKDSVIQPKKQVLKG